MSFILSPDARMMGEGEELYTNPSVHSGGPALRFSALTLQQSPQGAYLCHLTDIARGLGLYQGFYEVRRL